MDKLTLHHAAHISGMNDYYEVKRMDYADECINEREKEIARLERVAQKQERLSKEILEDDTALADIIQDYGLEDKLGDMVRVFDGLENNTDPKATEALRTIYFHLAALFNKALLDAIKQKAEQ